MVATCFRTVAPPCWMGEREGKRARSTSLIVICVRFRPHFVRPSVRQSERRRLQPAAGRPDGRAGGRAEDVPGNSRITPTMRRRCGVRVRVVVGSLSLPLSFLSSPPPSTISTSSHEVAFPLQKLAKCCLTKRKEEERPYIYYHSTPLSL